MSEAELAAEVASATEAAQVGPEDYDEPYAVGELRLSVDRPGPFTLREYVRLQLLRTRVQANPSPLDAGAVCAKATTLSPR